MSANIDPCTYLETVDTIAGDAGRRILEIYQGDFGVAHKEDGSPVTAADQAAQEVILGALARLTPAIPVLSEESTQVPHAERAQWRRFWLVDPLDGTKEFVSRNGEFTVNIALIERGTPILGVVHVPVKGVTYGACRGGAAYRSDAAASRVPIAARAYNPSRPPRVVASRSHAQRPDVEFLSRLGPHELVSMGSSLKFCLVAEGAADVYPRLGTTMEWDTAAAQCIVEVAGGKVLGPDGQPLRYNKPSLKNPWLVTCGAGDYDWIRFIPHALIEAQPPE